MTVLRDRLVSRFRRSFIRPPPSLLSHHEFYLVVREPSGSKRLLRLQVRSATRRCRVRRSRWRDNQLPHRPGYTQSRDLLSSLVSLSVSHGVLRNLGCRVQRPPVRRTTVVAAVAQEGRAQHSERDTLLEASIRWRESTRQSPQACVGDRDIESSHTHMPLQSTRSTVHTRGYCPEPSERACRHGHVPSSTC